MIQKIVQHLQIYKGMQPIGWWYVENMKSISYVILSMQYRKQIGRVW